MKNKLHLIAIILLVTLAGLSVNACGSNPLVGTWRGTINGIPATFVFTDKGFTLSNAYQSWPGTYTLNGNAAVLSIDGESTDALISGKTMTFNGNTFTKR